MMRTDLPWAVIARGKARRVDDTHVADFFWSVSSDGNAELLLDFPHTESLPAIPRLRGLTETVSPVESDRSRLCLRLSDNSLVDVFWRLCQDVIESTRPSRDAGAAAHIAIQRTWRWHHLLRGGGSGLLTPTEQKGLIGELALLRNLLRYMTPQSCVASWHGPLGSAKDFEIGRFAVEAKARNGTSNAPVKIHGAEQLETTGLLGLVLSVTDVVSAPPGQGQTLTEIVEAIFEIIRAADESVVELFEDVLSAAGYSKSDDYSSWCWDEGDTRVYQVTEEFPRIRTTTLPSAIRDVSYSLDVMSLADFRVDWKDIQRQLVDTGSES